MKHVTLLIDQLVEPVTRGLVQVNEWLISHNYDLCEYITSSTYILDVHDMIA